MSKLRVTVRGPYTAQQVIERPELYKRLKQLTNGGWGRNCSTLYPVLRHLRPKSKDKFWLAWHRGEVVGWVWLSPANDIRFFCPETSKATMRRTSTIGTFVHHKFRRQGIGKRLLKRVDEYLPRRIYLFEEGWNQAGFKLYENISHRTKCADCGMCNH